MTYGEAVMFQKLTMRMQNGVWVSDPMPAHVSLRKNLRKRSDAKKSRCRLA